MSDDNNEIQVNQGANHLHNYRIRYRTMWMNDFCRKNLMCYHEISVVRRVQHVYIRWIRCTPRTTKWRKTKYEILDKSADSYFITPGLFYLLILWNQKKIFWHDTRSSYHSSALVVNHNFLMILFNRKYWRSELQWNVTIFLIKGRHSKFTSFLQ